MSQLQPHNDSDPADDAAKQPPRPLDPNAPEDGPLKEQDDPEEPLEPVDPADPVDHRRPHGVPPPSNDDYSDDIVDHEGADSFPASDPPAGW
jgi:hypothetical protein